MNTTEEFIKNMVKVDFIKNVKQFGHYPFQLVSKDAEGKLTVAALALGGNVRAVYNSARKIWKDGAVKMFLSCDFPASEDIDHDFIVVFTITNDDVELIAIPYSTTTGKQFDWVTKSRLLEMIKAQFLSIFRN